MTDATLMSTPADAPAFADGAHARPALPGADERVTQDKHRREAAWRTAVAEAIGQAARGPAGEAPEFRAELVRRVAIMLWHEMANDLRVRIVKLLGWPLPKDHWLYAPRGEWDSTRDDYAETPQPILTNAQRQAVTAAGRYAVRGATMCGTEMDFDPDALVLNLCYALCGGRLVAPRWRQTSRDLRCMWQGQMTWCRSTTNWKRTATQTL